MELPEKVNAMPSLDEITALIIDQSVQIHRDLGPGLLESVYESILERSLQKKGLFVERQQSVSIQYEDIVIDEAFRADLIVHKTVILEIKSVEKLAPVHSKQLLTYLRLMRLPVGLLINFGAPLLKDGLHRVVNKLSPADSPTLAVNREPVAPIDT